MLKWEWEIIENKIVWRFVNIGEGFTKREIGSVISTEMWKDRWEVRAECTEIGYNKLFESVNKYDIRKVVLDIKKFIQEGVEKKNSEKKAIILR